MRYDMVAYKKALKKYTRTKSLRDSGMTLKEVAKIFKVSYQAIGARLKKGRPLKKSFELKTMFWGKLKRFNSGRDRTRMLVRIRDNFTCQDCGERRTIRQVTALNKNKRKLKGRKKLFDIHHIHGWCGKKSRGYDSINDLSKLITLCHKCHYNRPEHKVKSVEFSRKMREARKRYLNLRKSRIAAKS